MQISSTEEIISDFKKGRFVILIDHQDRENEGDLMLAAEFINAENLNFLLKEARGFVCLTLTTGQVQRLQLPLMKSAQHSSARNHAAFTYAFEAKNGITTGISARERAHSIQTAIKNSAQAQDIVTPGHVLALMGVQGGVLERAGHTEASLDLAQLSGLNPSAVICELLDEKGD
ncbi:MAG: 3,4-dihydroxy-2-butanone-4-phosphate synthase, partial [Pseudobdellovibrio sp.]